MFNNEIENRQEELRIMKLTTHLHLAPRLRMSVAQGQLYFT
jgi:hypothetical protein